MTILGSRNCSNADKVALTIFMVFDDPNVLDKTSVTPTASKTARTPPPAITPVPGAAGLSKTFEPENLVVIS